MSKWKPTTKAKRDLKTYFRLHGIEEKDCERAANNLIAWALVSYANEFLPEQSSARDLLDGAYDCAVNEAFNTEKYLAKKYPSLPEDFLLDALALVPKL